ncbi:MAG: flagellar biosynthetic protein FliO [Nitratireductor sp.]
MTAWLDGMIGPQYAPLVGWVLLALVIIVIVLLALRLLRGITAGTFIAGGRNRKARLAVMDATAIDTRRRLVLVRRDDVEHLILIGGTSDIVVEQDIRMIHKASRSITDEAEAPVRQPPPQPAPAPEKKEHTAARPFSGLRGPERTAPPARPAAPPVARPPSPQPAPPAAKQAPAWRQAEPAPAPRPQPAPARPAARAPEAPVAAAAPKPAPAPAPATHDDSDLDDALLRELNQSLSAEAPKTRAKDGSLDDEMTKLLGELSREGK